MDIQAPKPVSGVSSSTTQAAATSATTSQSVQEAVQPVVAPPPVARVEPADMQVNQEAIAEQVSRYLHSTTRNLAFYVDKEAGRAVIVVSDSDGNVIRRIPGEEALEVMRRANADSGTLIDSSA